MEFQKTNSNSDENLPRFITKKWVEVYDQFEKNYSPNKEIRTKTSMRRSDLCDYSDTYILVNITLEGDNNANKQNKNLTFKNTAPFINCISKINGVKIDNAEDLDVAMPLYNLFEYSKITDKQQEVCGIIIEMNQVILFFPILNLLNTKQISEEKYPKIMIH